MSNRETDREIRRLAALYEYDVLDTPPEESFDRITRLLKASLRKPITLISFMDRNRQWFKSVQGIDIVETPADVSFCMPLQNGNGPLVVEDALKDPRFRDNPYVTGDPNIRFYAGVPLKTPSGHYIGALCALDRIPATASREDMQVLHDLACLVVDELKLRKLAGVDSLTGTMTRRSFQRQAERELARAIRYGRDLACILLDIDHFKAVNDTYGHAAGDQALRTLAETCRGALRTMDLFGRLGGEEFAILMPETTLEGAIKTAERLRARIASAAFPNIARPITASFGVAAHETSDRRIENMLCRADRALYEAKDSGRDRVGKAA